MWQNAMLKKLTVKKNDSGLHNPSQQFIKKFGGVQFDSAQIATL
jgi:hypothetical protein